MALHVIIPRWDEFQHYKNRDPSWVKDYVRQLHDPAYLGLTLAERGLLKDLRLLYAASGRNVELHTGKLSRAFNVRVLNAQLVSLNRAGFIAVRASRMLDQRREEKKELGRNHLVPDWGQAGEVVPPADLLDVMRREREQGRGAA